MESTTKDRPLASVPEPDLEGPELDEPVAEAEPEKELEPPEEPNGQKTLLDRSHYETEGLQIPTIDRQTIDRIALKFAGTVFLDRSDEHDVALYNRLVLRGDVVLNVAAKCTSTGAKGATERDGQLDVVVGVKGLTVESVVLSTED